MNIFKRIERMLCDRNNEKNCFGVGVFKPLPEKHPFQRAAFLHDYEFDLAETGESKKHRAEVDFEFFYRMVLLAKAEVDADRQCDLAMTICRYWPLAREFGKYLYDGEE